MIDPAVLHFFSDELQKEAGIGSEVMGHLGGAARWAGGHLAEAGRAIKNAPGETVTLAKDIYARPAQTMREGWRASTTGKLNKGLMLGGTALGVAGAASAAPEHRAGEIGGLVGGTVAGIAGARAGILPGLALGIAGDVAGRTVGKGISKGVGMLRGSPRPAVAQPPPVQG